MKSLRYLSIVLFVIGVGFKILHYSYADILILAGGILFSLLWVPHLVRKYVYKK